MTKKYIKIQGEEVQVSEELYEEYYKMDRRRRYLEDDIKVGSSEIDLKTGRVIFKPSKEDSLQRLTDVGVHFEDGQSVEDIVCDRATLLILQEALKELDENEQKLIRDIYYKEKTTREIAKENNVSQPAIVKRCKRQLYNVGNRQFKIVGFPTFFYILFLSPFHKRRNEDEKRYSRRSAETYDRWYQTKLCSPSETIWL